MLKLFSFMGLPESITTDEQSSLNSQLMTTLNKQLGIKTHTTAPYSHVALAERFNRTIGTMIKAFVENEKQNWEQYCCLISVLVKISLVTQH